MHILGLYSSGDGREKIWEKLLNWIAIEEKQKKVRIKCSLPPPQLKQLDKLYMLFSFSPMWGIRARVQELHEFWQLGELTRGFRKEDKP